MNAKKERKERRVKKSKKDKTKSGIYGSNTYQHQPFCELHWQVQFSDYSGAIDLTAVQLDKNSEYDAEDTSFLGFTGEVRGHQSTISLHRFVFCSSYVNKHIQ